LKRASRFAKRVTWQDRSLPPRRRRKMNEIFVKVFIFILVLVLLIVEVFHFTISFWEIVIKVIVLIFLLIIIIWETRKNPNKG
jgi:protein-S-isoprenylcysteine O-methyltransferase Ste14